MQEKETGESARKGTEHKVAMEECGGGVVNLATKTGQKISPPKKRAPFLGDLLRTPSIEKGGRMIFMSHEVDEIAEEKSFDFGELSSVEDCDLENTVRLDQTDINIQSLWLDEIDAVKYIFKAV